MTIYPIVAETAATCTRCGTSPAPFKKGALQPIGAPFKNGQRRKIWVLTELLCAHCALGTPCPRVLTFDAPYNRTTGLSDVVINGLTVGDAPSRLEAEQVKNAALNAMRRESLSLSELANLWWRC